MEAYQDLEPGYNTPKDVHLQDWVFNYNPYTKQWAAVPRASYQNYWSNYNTEGVYKSKNINTLIEVLIKSKGDPKEIEKLIKK